MMERSVQSPPVGTVCSGSSNLDCVFSLKRGVGRSDRLSGNTFIHDEELVVSASSDG